jgi:hypothetical protein
MQDLGFDSITIDERFCRGDWSEPKSEASTATLGVDRYVIERIHRLKLLTVEVREGRAIRRYKIVKSDVVASMLIVGGLTPGRPKNGSYELAVVARSTHSGGI